MIKLDLVPGTVIAIMFFAMSNIVLAADSVQHLQQYRQQGVDQTDTTNGQKLWYSVVNNRSCTSCHNDNPVNAGRHAKTGKPIEPMALSVNPERYRDGKKIEKWFLRNCKWTFGRQCSVQEKANILTWLSSQ